MTDQQRDELKDILAHAEWQDKRDAILDQWHQAIREFEDHPVSDAWKGLLLAGAAYQAEWLGEA